MEPGDSPPHSLFTPVISYCSELFLLENGWLLKGTDVVLRQRMNLTAVREAGAVMERHVEDSLAIIPELCDSYSSFGDGSMGNLRVVDVGSGAGLPGIVLAIARPGIGNLFLLWHKIHVPISVALEQCGWWCFFAFSAPYFSLK